MAAPFLMREPEAASRVRVLRADGRAHWIAAATFDPSRHTLADALPTVGTQQSDAAQVDTQPAKRRPGRPRKHPL